MNCDKKKKENGNEDRNLDELRKDGRTRNKIENQVSQRNRLLKTEKRIPRYIADLFRGTR